MARAHTDAQRGAADTPLRMAPDRHAWDPDANTREPIMYKNQRF